MNICILGSGFAALTAIKNMRKQLPEAKITVIAPCKEIIYLPSLIWIPSGLRKSKDLAINLDNFFKRQKVEFIAASVQALTDGGRTVITNQGEFKNDGLIIATGGRFIKKLPGIENVITPCEGIAAAEKIKEALSKMTGGTIAIGFGANPKEPSAMRGGPMFEFLFGIDTLLRRQAIRDNFKLIFFNPALEPGKRLGAKVPASLVKMMKSRNIETHLGNKIKGFESNKVITEAGEFDADLILFMPGMTGPEWIEKTELPKSEGGLIKANKYCQIEGFEKTYVAGDSGSFEGPDWQPKQAHAADLQAKSAVTNLVKELKGKQDFVAFKHELICIVDTLSHGILVKRTESGTLMLPPCRLMHYAKRLFEKVYLYKYR